MIPIAIVATLILASYSNAFLVNIHKHRSIRNNNFATCPHMVASRSTSSSTPTTKKKKSIDNRIQKQPQKIKIIKDLTKSSLDADITTSDNTSTTHLSDIEFNSLQCVSNQSRRAVAEILKYKYLTKVQHATLESVLSGIDVVAKAKTGTGKTVAFLLPMIERIIEQRNAPSNSISGLILSPTRELAIQIAKEAEVLTTFHDNISIGCFIGGTNVNKDIKKLQRGIDILVVTPGRLIDHLKNNNANIRERVRNLSTLVMDEADQLLDMGFKKEIDTILSYLPSTTDRQTLLYSATFTQSVKIMAKAALKPHHVFIDTIEEGDQQTNTHVPQESMTCTIDEVTSTLETILTKHMQSQNVYKILVFFNTARTAGFMAQLFQTAGYNTLEMHSRKSQSFRAKRSKEFHEGKNIMMFSSDVSARGVDYPDVTLIVQVGLTDKQQYIHRLGRTGRAGRTGRGILLLCDFEKQFLKELKDLDISHVETPNSNHDQLKTTALLKRLPKALQPDGERAYAAYLGYYNSNLKRIGLNKPALVELANHFSRTIGFKDPPKLQKKTVGKMGLKGTPGLRIC